MIRRWLYDVSAGLPCRLINDGTRRYLERYYLGDLLGMRFYLHRFVDHDPDRGLHDHPWRWAASIVLSGFYYETRRWSCSAVRWFNFLTGDTFHRVLLPTDRFGRHPRECWTLFFHDASDDKTPWGFLRPVNGFDTYFQYGKGGPADRWWLTAPNGRDANRMPFKVVRE